MIIGHMYNYKIRHNEFFVMHNNDTFCNCRYMAGDQTLIQEINANAESTAPIAEAARATLGEQGDIPGPTVLLPGNEQDNAICQRMEFERVRIYGLHSVISAMCILNSLNPMWRNDTVLVQHLEDQIRQIMMIHAGARP